MKNILKSIMSLSAFVVATFSFTSCENYFESPIAENITQETIYSSMYNAERGLNAAYYAIPYKWAWSSVSMEDNIRTKTPLRLDMITSISDESVSISTWSGALNAYYGTTSVIPGNVGLENTTWRHELESLYEEPYYYIRYAYLFLEYVDSVPDATATWLAEKKGEAKILIAMCWYELIKRYGSVPYVSGSLSTNDFSETSNDRPPLMDLINNVDALLAEAITTAPDKFDESSEDYGRVTKATAYFLRSRLWLLAASPIFNTNTPYSTAGLVESNEICLGYAEGSDEWKAVWQKAADYSLAAINYCEANGYSMNDVTTGKSTEWDVLDAYRDIFRGVVNNPEIIQFSRRVGTLNGNSSGSHWVGRNMPPISTGGNWAATGFVSPNHDFIHNMFRNVDGTEFVYGEANKGKDPWANADRRFKSIIVYDGCDWGDKTTMWWDHSSNGNNVQGTGYFMRKFMHDEWQLGTYSVDVPYYYMRLPELYFNYAEALCELDYAGNLTTIETYINKTTARMGGNGVGAAYIELSGLGYEDVRDAIRREKAVEFMFEDQRYFDVKRWLIADKTIGKDKTTIWRNDTTTILSDAAWESDSRWYYENTEDTQMVARQINWEDKQYLMPFPQYEINLNMGLNQNPGY
ncbi:MAG: RagB/SusD family nutrient uptake outer membrane protein [Rikenellaceae bacterium]